MKLQNKFTILVIVIIIIPVLVASMVAYIQFIFLHKNQMLFNKTYIMEWVNKRLYTLGQTRISSRREEGLPKGLDIRLFDSNMRVLASSFEEYEQRTEISEEEISDLMADLKETLGEIFGEKYIYGDTPQDLIRRCRTLCRSYKVSRRLNGPKGT
jgi:hypothetical protein